ncbi:MAG: hypothetical protein J4473_01925 [Candidatus Aenigmarchaeota archaeon]|nr:hypothetical protein [Candidatus Aenigmarchaeota archaeon]
MLSGDEHMPNIPIEFIGLENQDEADVNKIYSICEQITNRYKNRLIIKRMIVKFTEHKKESSRILHEVKVDVHTSLGIFAARSEGWKFVPIAHESLKKIEHEMEHKLGKMKGYSRERLEKEIRKQQEED